MTCVRREVTCTVYQQMYNFAHVVSVVLLFGLQSTSLQNLQFTIVQSNNQCKRSVDVYDSCFKMQQNAVYDAQQIKWQKQGSHWLLTKPAKKPNGDAFDRFVCCHCVHSIEVWTQHFDLSTLLRFPPVLRGSSRRLLPGSVEFCCRETCTFLHRRAKRHSTSSVLRNCLADNHRRRDHPEDFQRRPDSQPWQGSNNNDWETSTCYHLDAIPWLRSGVLRAQ